MNTTATLNLLKELKLAGMARSYESILQLSSHQQPDAHSLIAQMCDAELQSRVYHKTQFYLKLSKLRYAASLEELSFTKERNLTKEQVEAEVLKTEDVLRVLDGKTPKKVIVVPGRIVNIVV